MMLYETLVFVTTLFVLTWVGLGFALALGPSGARKLEFALATAPTIGFGLIVLFLFPLYRFIAPVKMVALPLTIVLGLISTVLIFLDWKRNSGVYLESLRRRNWFFLLAFFGVLVLLWLSPLVLFGIQYAIYRFNPSDAFFYISIGEITRVVPWTILERGATLTTENLANVRQLATVSPSALFAARFVLSPHPLGKMLFEAWAAQLFGVPVYRFYFASNLVPCVLAFPLAFLLADTMNVPRGMKYLGAATIAFGFWVRVSLEHDAGYEVTLAPFILLLVLAWIQVESETPRVMSRARGLMALAFAFVLALYIPPLSIVMAGGLIYYGLGLFHRTVSIKSAIAQLATLAFALGILAVTGQLDFLAKSWYFFASIIKSEQANEAPALLLFRAEQLHVWRGFWGMPDSLVAGWTENPFRFVLRAVSDVVGILLSACLGAALFLGWSKRSGRAEQLVLAIAIAVVGLMVSFWALGFPSAAGREFTYGFAFLVLAMMLVAKYARNAKRIWVARGVPTLIAVWMVLEITLGLGLPFIPISILPSTPRLHTYALESLTNYLDQHPPHLLLVAVPKTNDWQFAYYVMHVLQPYPTYFQSGLVVDNFNTTPAWWFDPLSQVPDYAVIARDEDYIGKNNWGTPVAETPDLILYRLTTTDLTALNAQESIFRARDGK